MKSPVRDLPLPRRGDGKSSRSSSGKASGDVGGWDENVGVSSRFDFGVTDEYSPSASIARHAVSNGTSVLGTNPPGRSTAGGTVDDGWVRWETSFEPCLVQKVASNSDGFVIAVSNTGGAVALLRGADGSFLATRRVSPAEDDSSNEPVDVTFVSGAVKHGSNVKDVLLIVASEFDDKSIAAQCNGLQALDERQNDVSNVLVVSGIDGAKLNCDIKSLVGRAARGMEINSLDLDLPFGSGGHVVSMNGCFLDEKTIRFLVADSHGNISVHDYNVHDKKSTVVKTDAFSEICVGGKMVFNRTIGFKVDCEAGNRDYFLIPSSSGYKSRIAWFDVQNLGRICEFTVPSSVRNERQVMIAAEGIKGCDNYATVAAALAFQSTSNDVLFLVVQAITDNHVEKGKQATSQASVVYRIPIESNDPKSPLLSVDIASTYEKAFYFRFNISFDTKTSKCQEFIASDGDVAGNFRVLLAKGRFDEADELLSSLSPRSYSSCSSGQYASIHSSEVALSRFKSMLSSLNITMDSMSQAKECLRRLSAGAVSGGEIGFRCLLEASDSVLAWPTDSTFSSSGGDASLRIGSYRMALEGMSKTIAGAAKAVSPARFPEIQEAKSKLDAKESALRCLERLFLTHGNDAVCLSAPLSDVTSIPHLFQILIAQGALTVAEQIRRSEFGRPITPEIMATSAVEIPPTIDPRSYCNWLKDAVLPGLSINHPLLICIRVWTCQVADDFDDSDDINLGVDAAIRLLRTVAEGTANLSMRTNLSFASSSPFRDEKAWKLPEVIPTAMDSPSPDSPQSLCSSFSSLGFLSPVNQSVRRYSLSQVTHMKPPNPTIMKLSDTRESETKPVTKSLLARRTDTSSSGVTPLMSLSSNNNTERLTIDTEVKCGENDSVEVKLREAERLKEARTLGLPKQVVSLRTYEKVGGSNYVAKELLRVVSGSSSGSKRSEALSSQVKPFCDRAQVSFDDAVAEYAKDICDRIAIDTEAIEEAVHLCRLCSSPKNCQVMLKVLHAAHRCSVLPESLFQLSQEALSWTTDEEIRTKLEEELRLLVIYGIVRRYIGNAACEVFRVSDTRHGLKLLQHVCRHIDEPSVLSDAIALCDAFAHLSRLEACVQILQGVILAPENGSSKSSFRVEQCDTMFQFIYSIDVKLAESAGIRLCMFCFDVIEKSSDRLMDVPDGETKKRNAKAASSAAVRILSVLHERSSRHNLTVFEPPSYFVKSGSTSWSSLLREIQRINQLQHDFDTFISLSCLRKGDRSDQISEYFIRAAIKRLEDKDCSTTETKSALSHARRGCRLLFGDDDAKSGSSWWRVVGLAASQLAMKCDSDSTCVELVLAAGLLGDVATETGTVALVSLASSLCDRASKEVVHISIETRENEHTQPQNESILFAMRCIVRANDLLEHVLTFCSNEHLSWVLSLSTLTEIVNEVLVRTDSGVGEFMDKFIKQLRGLLRKRFNSSFVTHLTQPEYDENGGKRNGDQSTSKSEQKIKLLPSSPTLHTSWYIGDGLLLPPLESLMLSLDFCKVRYGFPCRSSKQDETFFSFLGSRGAYSLALRMLSFSSSNALMENVDSVDGTIMSNSFSSSSEAYRPTWLQDNIRCLAERSLGGSGAGLTSGNIDSQLAVSYILLLPLKPAFKVYKACLPSAMSRRDFDRVATIANIGVRCGTYSFTSPQSSGGWSNQKMFVDQCQKLSSNARWWNALQKLGVSFEPQLFSAEGIGSHPRGSENSGNSLKYVASLVPSLIQGSSNYLVKNGGHPDQVLLLAAKYVKTFGLDPKLAPQKQIEFSLSCPSGDDDDIRNDLDMSEKIAKQSLLLLPSPISRSAALRRCLIGLEAAERCRSDYERFAVVLSLYRNELISALQQTSGKHKLDVAAFRSELDKIERRIDVLAVLSRFFRGEKYCERPPYPEFFLPLPNPFKVDGEIAKSRVDILGPYSNAFNSGDFDPLRPLKSCLSADSGTSTATALSKLCLFLGLPQGYIHARSLVERFVSAKCRGFPLPPFKACLFVFQKIQDARDGAKLAEWCALQYGDGSKDRLRCLEHALKLAMRASQEAEKRRLQNDDITYAKQEQDALNTVKRISKAKDALSDRMRVQSILSRQCRRASNSTAVFSILSTLVDQVHANHSGDEHMSPDDFVDGLLCEGSLMAAKACLDNSIFFSMEDVRQVASAVHQACKSLSDRYSHIHVGMRARALTRRWLFHGDNFASLGINEIVRKVDTSLQIQMDDEEDTVNFVLDLKSLGGQEAWADNFGTSKNAPENSKGLVAEEEPTALGSHVSARERSEYDAARVGIRVAFVMLGLELVYADDCQINTDCHTEYNEVSNDENMDPSLRAHVCSKSSPLKSRVDTTPPENEIVMAHARELLGIVFARAEEVIFGGQSIVTSQRSASHSVKSGRERPSTRSHTFAMRHRAFRAASVLCPQESLEIVLREEGFLKDLGVEASSTLRKCFFGSFLAMEIESMGLPLPHSDLIQLSTMHFSSYARALWRHHGTSVCRGYKGRLLLLLLELCLKDGKISDPTLVTSILDELSSLELPRTLLRSSELIADLDCLDPLLAVDKGASLSNLIKKTAQLILSEIQRGLTSDIDIGQCTFTLERLCGVIADLEVIGLRGHLPFFIQVMCKLAKASSGIRADLCLEILSCATSAACCLLEKDERRNAFFSIAEVSGGRAALLSRYVESCNDNEVDSFGNTCNSAIQRIEDTFKADLAAALKVTDGRNSFGAKD